MENKTGNIQSVLGDEAWVSCILWARPVSWRGAGIGLTLARPGSQAIRLVPSLHGGEPWHPMHGDLLEAWELVSPDEVLAERVLT